LGFTAIYRILQDHFRGFEVHLEKPTQHNLEEPFALATAGLDQAEAKIGFCQALEVKFARAWFASIPSLKLKSVSEFVFVTLGEITSMRRISRSHPCRRQSEYAG
jgi:hypothetical protein